MMLLANCIACTAPGSHTRYERKTDSGPQNHCHAGRVDRAPPRSVALTEMRERATKPRFDSLTGLESCGGGSEADGQ